MSILISKPREAMISSICSLTLNAVPIGTVDLITTNESLDMLFPILSAAE